jgi:hypothetical protein
MIDGFKRRYTRLMRPIGGCVESVLAPHEVLFRWPPIFIVGPARSGTTLTYQCLLHTFRTSYLANVMAAFPNLPAFVGWALSWLSTCTPRRNFESSHGSTSGWNAPSQASRTWGYWFNKPQRQLLLRPNDIRQMRRIVKITESCYEAPFVGKWPGFSVYLRSLSQVFPEARFVRVRRNATDVASSVLQARRNLRQDARARISRHPSGYASHANGDPIEQVCAYVLGVEADITRDLQAVGPDRCIDVEYASLCRDPGLWLSEFRCWYREATGYELQQRFDAPAPFQSSRGKKVSDSERQEIQQNLARLACEFEFTASVG